MKVPGNADCYSCIGNLFAKEEHATDSVVHWKTSYIVKLYVDNLPPWFNRRQAGIKD